MLPRPTCEAQRISISNAKEGFMDDASALRMTGHYRCYLSLLITNPTVSVHLETLMVSQMPRNYPSEVHKTFSVVSCPEPKPFYNTPQEENKGSKSQILAPQCLL
jgi:hypothetical protein